MTQSRAVALARIQRVANHISDAALRERLVFIGGSVLPLLADVDGRFMTPRSTTDVDAIAATTSYRQIGTVEELLRASGFRHVMTSHESPETHAIPIPMNRWRTPDGLILDLSFSGNHSGGTGSRVDAAAVRTAVPMEDDSSLRHVSASGFFLMKVAAYVERRQRTMRDLDDLVVLMAGRTSLVEELEQSEADVRTLVRDHARQLLTHPDLDDAIRRVVRNRMPIPPETPVAVSEEVIDIVRTIAAR